MRRLLTCSWGHGSIDIYGEAIAYLAQTFTALGRPGDALRVLARLPGSPAKPPDSRVRVMLLRERARAELALGRPAESVRWSRQAVAVFKQRHGPIEIVKAEAVHGEALLAAGRVSAAERALTAAACRLDEMLVMERGAAARMGLLESNRAVHDSLMRLHLAEGQKGWHEAWRGVCPAEGS